MPPAFRPVNPTNRGFASRGVAAGNFKSADGKPEAFRTECGKAAKPIEHPPPAPASCSCLLLLHPAPASCLLLQHLHLPPASCACPCSCILLLPPASCPFLFPP